MLARRKGKTRCAERYGHTGEDRDDGLVDGLNLLLLEEVAREEGRYEEAYRDEDGPRGERLALRDIICWTASAPNKLWRLHRGYRLFAMGSRGGEG